MSRPRWDRPAAMGRGRWASVPRPWIADALVALAGLGMGITVALVLTTVSHSSLSAPGGWFDFAGRMCAMVGTYLLIIMVIMVARVPGLERAIGHDRLVYWHRKLGGWPVLLIGAHIVLVTLGYAAAAKTGAIHQLVTLVTSYPDMIQAAIGAGVMAVAIALSLPPVRRMLAYEKWWAVHLSLYVALGLSFLHQIHTGIMFIGHPLAILFWTGLFVGSAVLILVGRVVMPVVLNARHQLRVAAVERVAPGVVALTISGRKLDRLAVAGGQFFQWRFLSQGLWFHAHPYSLSALPRPPFLRVTVKDLGDHSGALAGLRVGTRVLVEGPYGTFTHHRRATNKVTLIGAGVGVTPLRAMLDDLPQPLDLSVLVRASREEDLVHGPEVAALVARRHGRYIPVVGSRHEVSLDARTLAGLVPGIAQGDIYLCGPRPFIDSTEAALAQLGAPPERIHSELFAF